MKFVILVSLGEITQMSTSEMHTWRAEKQSGLTNKTLF